MNTVLLKTKQDYINYCKDKDLLSYKGEQYIKFDNSEKSMIPIKDSSFIESEPLNYPCILTWIVDDLDYYHGTFIYPRDFELMKRYNN